MIEYYKKVVFDNYANFEGRARRSEYWYFILCHIIMIFLVTILGVVLATAVGGGFTGGLLAIMPMLLYFFGTFVPYLAVIVRRLHDQGKSGTYIFVAFIPAIGGFWLLFLMCTDGDHGDNQYGRDPKLGYEDLDEIGAAQA